MIVCSCNLLSDKINLFRPRGVQLYAQKHMGGLEWPSPQTRALRRAIPRPPIARSAPLGMLPEAAASLTGGDHRHGQVRVGLT